MDYKEFLKNIKNKLSEFRKTLRLRIYYTEKQNEGKTYIAALIDKVIVRVLIIFILFFAIYIKTNSALFSVLITVQLYMLYHFLAYRINKNKMKKKIEKTNKVVVEEKILKDLINKSPYDFINFIKELLQKCGLKDIKILNRKDIDIIATLSKQKVGIKCFQYNTDYKVGINNIRDFFLELRHLKIKEGIIITTSAFSKDIDSFLPKIANYVSIKLFDLEDITRLMQKAELYPSESEIKRIVLSEISENRPKLANYKETVLSKNKILKYFLIGTILQVFSRITPYKMYYKIASYLLIFIGIVTLIGFVINLSAKRKVVQEDNNIL